MTNRIFTRCIWKKVKIRRERVCNVKCASNGLYTRYIPLALFTHFILARTHRTRLFIYYEGILCLVLENSPCCCRCCYTCLLKSNWTILYGAEKEGEKGAKVVVKKCETWLNGIWIECKWMQWYVKGVRVMAEGRIFRFLIIHHIKLTYFILCISMLFVNYNVRQEEWRLKST